VAVVAKRFEVYLVNLDPTIGREIRRTRPCLIISPNEMNEFISTVIVAPMTSRRRKYPSRMQCKFKGKEGEVVLDQIRAVDKRRLAKRLGTISKRTQSEVLYTLAEIFSS